MVTPPRRPLGFTLVEVMVAGAVGTIAVAGTAALATQTVYQHRRDLEHARLRAGMNLAFTQLSYDLRHAGLGVPRGPNASSGAPYLAPLFQAGADSLGMVGDLPHPATGERGFQPIGPGGLHANAESGGACPLCPAASAPGDAEVVVVSNARGAWRESIGLPSLAPDFLDGPNRGTVSTPDRVFYRVDDGTLLRAQCWGSVTVAPEQPCREGPDGTGWERLVPGVQSFALTYFAAQGAPLVPPLDAATTRKVQRVHVTLVLRDTPPGPGPAIELSGETTVALRP